MSNRPQLVLTDLQDEISVDLFAGAGGASLAYEMATGRSPDIAINHSPRAVAMHMANHPETKHYVSDVFEVDPRLAVGGRKVGFLWMSPDCTGFSKAKGAAPRREKDRKRRALAWVGLWWAGTVRPRVIMLENVEEFVKWTRLVGKPGQLRECKKTVGRRFKTFVRSLRNMGYVVDWRELRACDYGAPTIRKRLFLIARCDGQPIVWPEPTHGDPKTDAVKEGRLKPWRGAAECIDFTIPMLSIFATKEEAAQWGKDHGRRSPKRPLEEKSMRRIARGVQRYVIDSKDPYLELIDYEKGTSTRFTGGVGGRAAQSKERAASDPFGTITSKADAAIFAPTVMKYRADSVGCDIRDPLPTVTANSFTVRPGGAAPLGLAAITISPITHGNHDRRTPPAGEPLATITCAARGEFALLATMLVPRYGEREGQDPRCRSVQDPSPTVVPTGNGGYLVAAHISTYYGEKGSGNARGSSLAEPLRTIPTENRYALVYSWLGQNNGGFADGNSGDGRPIDYPASTITNRGANQSLMATVMTHANTGHTVCAHGSRQSLVAVNMVHANYGAKPFTAGSEPLHTIVAGGWHHQISACHISRPFGQSVGSDIAGPIGSITGGGMGHAELIGSFLAKYNGTAVGQEIDAPIHTIPTHDRFGLVKVKFKKVEYVITDVLMRMLRAFELAQCQGFPKGYILDHDVYGVPFTETEQVQMIGNSVSPPPACALIEANVPDMIDLSLKELRSA